jgi:hypothetical protein
MLGIAVLLAAGAAQAQHTTIPGFAIDRGVLAELCTYWLPSHFLRDAARASSTERTTDDLGFDRPLRRTGSASHLRRVLTRLVESSRALGRLARSARVLDRPAKTTASRAALVSVTPTPPVTKVDAPISDSRSLAEIRSEIKGRLPYVQACVEAGKRRGGASVRRLQVVWSIGADGSIRQFRLEGVLDPWLAGCIARTCRRPFAAKPGVELTVPAPILFLR